MIVPGVGTIYYLICPTRYPETFNKKSDSHAGIEAGHRASKHSKPSEQMEGEIDNSAAVVGEFNTSTFKNG